MTFLATYRKIWFWHFLLGYFLFVPVIAQHNNHIQLFSSLDREAVATTETFIWEIELWATPEDTKALTYAFQKGQIQIDQKHFDLIKSEKTETWSLVQMTPVLKLTFRVFMRAKTLGTWKTPTFSFEVNRRRFETLPHEISVYEIVPSFRQAQRSVVPILAYHTTENIQRVRMGSAFPIAPHAFVTSYHAVAQATHIRFFLPNGKQIETKKAWVLDPVHDIAILYINPKATEAASMSTLNMASPMNDRFMTQDSTEVPVVFTSGWPSGIQQATSGLLFQDLHLPALQTHWVSSNPVHPGDSGGPVLDKFGNVLGVVSMGNDRNQFDPLAGSICISRDPRPAIRAFMQTKKPQLLAQLRQQHDGTEAIYRDAMSKVDALTQNASQKRRNPQWVHQQLNSLETTITTAKEDIALLYLKGSMYQLMGEDTAAEHTYSSIISQDKRHFLAGVAVARYALQNHQYTKAIQVLKGIENVKPYESIVAYGLSYAYMKRGSYEQALPYLTKLLQKNHYHLAGLYWLGQYHLKQGNEIEALQIIVKLERKKRGKAWADALKKQIRYPQMIVLDPIQEKNF